MCLIRTYTIIITIIIIIIIIIKAYLPNGQVFRQVILSQNR